MLRIGLVSDTHGLFDERLRLLFADTSLILHAGDIGKESVLTELNTIAPTLTIRGNIDLSRPTANHPDWLLRTFHGWRILMVHDLGHPERLRPEVNTLAARTRPQLIIAGHSHKAAAYRGKERLYLNPGSAGPRRFRLERTAAILELDQFTANFHVHSLEEASLPERLRMADRQVRVAASAQPLNQRG